MLLSAIIHLVQNECVWATNDDYNVRFCLRLNVYSALYLHILYLQFNTCCFLSCVTWFLKDSFLTGSSAARLMLLSRMKKRMRLVKMLWLTILWHRTLNLKKYSERNIFESLITIEILNDQNI